MSQSDSATQEFAAEIAVAVAEIWRNDPPPPPPMASRQDVATYLGCSLRSVKALVRAGRLTETRLSSKWVRYSWDAIHAFVRDNVQVIADPEAGK